MDNTNDWLASSYHNLLAQFRFVKFCGCFVMIKPMSKPFKLVVNFLFQQLKTQLSIYLIVTITIRSRKWIFLMSQIQHLTDFKTLKTLIFTEFMLNLHTEFLHFAIFLRDALVLLRYWHTPETGVFKCWLTMASFTSLIF